MDHNFCLIQKKIGRRFFMPYFEKLKKDTDEGDKVTTPWWDWDIKEEIKDKWWEKVWLKEVDDWTEITGLGKAEMDTWRDTVAKMLKLSRGAAVKNNAIGIAFNELPLVAQVKMLHQTISGKKTDSLWNKGWKAWISTLTHTTQVQQEQQQRLADSGKGFTIHHVSMLQPTRPPADNYVLTGSHLGTTELERKLRKIGAQLMDNAALQASLTRSQLDYLSGELVIRPLQTFLNTAVDDSIPPPFNTSKLKTFAEWIIKNKQGKSTRLAH
jgi:hypothetical protein